MTPAQVGTAARHFIIAALWADKPESGEWTAAPGTMEATVNFIRRFIDRYPVSVTWVMNCEQFGYGSHPDAGSPEAAFGHDLFLTCAGHGVGFWDRKELPAIGTMISKDIVNDSWYVETEFDCGQMYLSFHEGRLGSSTDKYALVAVAMHAEWCGNPVIITADGKPEYEITVRNLRKPAVQQREEAK